MDSTESSGSAADSYIDSFISLISKSQIRYQGFLFHLNPQQSTIGLRNVKSFGTEGRRKDEPQVLPSDKIYEYIFFRGSDIEDLQVISSPPVQSTTAVPNDPAIIQFHYPCLPSASSSFPPDSAVPATNISSNTRLGHSFPTVGTGFPSLISNMPPPLALLSTVPTRQSATLPSKLSPNLMPNNASNALPTVTVGSNSTLASPLTTSSLDVNPVVPPVMDKPKPVFDPALPNQTISQSMPSVVGLSSPVHSESSIPSLLTAGQLLQPGSTGQSSPHLQTAHRDIEVDQTSTSESVSSDSKNANNPAESLKSPYAAKLNGAALHSHDSNKRHVQGRGNTPNKTAPHLHHCERDHARGKGNWLNGAALRSHYNYRGHARGKANVLNGAVLHSHHSCRDHARGRANLNGAALHTHQRNRGHFRGRENGPKTASVQTNHSYRGCGWRNGTEVCPTTTKFTEDFDFEAMNEKFNKEKIWGQLGKKNKTTLEDDEGEENNNDANVAEEEDEDGLIKFVMKSFYVKDNFFDSLSCNSPNHELGRGRANLSEQRRIDIETFGEIPRHQRGHSSQGGPGWGGQSQGGSYRGRGHGYVGKGRGRTVWCRVT